MKEDHKGPFLIHIGTYRHTITLRSNKGSRRVMMYAHQVKCYSEFSCHISIHFRLLKKQSKIDPLLQHFGGM